MPHLHGEPPNQRRNSNLAADPNEYRSCEWTALGPSHGRFHTPGARAQEIVMLVPVIGLLVAFLFYPMIYMT